MCCVRLRSRPEEGAAPGSRTLRPEEPRGSRRVQRSPEEPRDAGQDGENDAVVNNIVQECAEVADDGSRLKETGTR